MTAVPEVWLFDALVIPFKVKFILNSSFDSHISHTNVVIIGICFLAFKNLLQFSNFIFTLNLLMQENNLPSIRFQTKTTYIWSSFWHSVQLSPIESKTRPECFAERNSFSPFWPFSRITCLSIISLKTKNISFQTYLQNKQQFWQSAGVPKGPTLS